jgi:hypothetical protein
MVSLLAVLSVDPYRTIGPRTRRFLLGTELHKMGKCHISVPPVFQGQSGKLTICGLAVGIDHLWAFIGASLPVAKGVNSSMMEFLDAVACL